MHSEKSEIRMTKSFSDTKSCFSKLERLKNFELKSMLHAHLQSENFARRHSCERCIAHSIVKAYKKKSPFSKGFSFDFSHSSPIILPLLLEANLLRTRLSTQICELMTGSFIYTMTKKNTTSSTPQDDYYETHPAPATTVTDDIDKKPKVLKIKAKKSEDGQLASPTSTSSVPTPRHSLSESRPEPKSERKTLDQILAEKNKIKSVSKSPNLVSFEAAAAPTRLNAPVAGSLPRDTSRFVASAKRKSNNQSPNNHRRNNNSSSDTRDTNTSSRSLDDILSDRNK